MAQANRSDTIITAKFKYCHEPNCSFGDDLHLLVQRNRVSLKASAVAISYTWGEFYRRKVKIGHDLQHNPISLVLAIEWNTAELIIALSSICLGDDGQPSCWIDQLCLPQGEDELRESLARIPTIYRTLKVIVLMPGQPCECFFKSFKQLFQDKPERGNIHQEVFEAAAIDWQTQLGTCLNRYGASTYMERMWTRQEFFYSRRMRVVWTGREAGNTVMCTKSEAQLENLSGFANLLFIHFRSFLREAPELAINRVREFNKWFMISMAKALSNYAGRPADDQGFYDMYDFFSGKDMSRAAEPDDLDPMRRIQDFLNQLGEMGTENRQATKPQDYVVSAWVDCPGYILPKSYKSMSLPILLEDAVIQLESNWGVSFSVNAPQSLFRGPNGYSARWRPTAAMNQYPSNTVDVYGALQHPFQVLPFVNDGNVPLHNLDESECLDTSSLFCSHKVQPYSTLFRNQDSVEVCDLLGTIVANWSRYVHSRAHAFLAYDRRNLPRSSGDNNLQAVSVFQGLLLGTSVNHSGFSADQNLAGHWDRVKEHMLGHHRDIDHEEAMYQLTAKALGLDITMCKRLSLTLVVSFEEPPYIGIADVPFDGKTATVLTASGTPESGYALTEVANVGTKAEKVCTVWVPVRERKVISLKSAGANKTEGNPDSFIV